MTPEDQILKLGEERAKELGLKQRFASDYVLDAAHRFISVPFYSVGDVHRLLGAGLEIFGKNRIEGVPMSDFYYQFNKNASLTTQALLIGIRPIVQAAAESLLRELLDAHEKEGRYGAHYFEVEARAKKFLGDK